jgi:hypothetical protein
LNKWVGFGAAVMGALSSVSMRALLLFVAMMDGLFIDHLASGQMMGVT